MLRDDGGRATHERQRLPARVANEFERLAQQGAGVPWMVPSVRYSFQAEPER